MNLPAAYTTDIDRLRRGLHTIGIPVVTASSPEFTYPIDSYLYRNSDGSIRWLWPVDATEPDFLRFYQVDSRRAKLFVWTVRLLFRIGLGRLVAHDRLTLYTSESGNQLVRKSHIKRWALSTGAPGPNRKIVIWHCMRSGKRYLTKIAVGPAALTSLRQEARALRHLQQAPFLQISTPELTAYSLRFIATGFLIQEDMGITCTSQTNPLTQLPERVVQELFSRNWHTQPLHQTSFWQQAHQNLAALKAANDPRIPTGLLDKLDLLMRSLNDQIAVPIAAAHGNFTPWTVLLTDRQVSIVDWEHYADELPGLYDFFYFLYQSTIRIGDQNYSTTRRLIDDTLNRPEWKLFQETYKLDTALAEILYLIQAVTATLLEYTQQTNWPEPINGQLKTWNDALTHWLNRQDSISDHQLLFYDVAFWLHQQPDKDLSATSHSGLVNDAVKLCLSQSAALQLTYYLQHHSLLSELVAKPHKGLNQLCIRCLDNSSLYIDLNYWVKPGKLNVWKLSGSWLGTILMSLRYSTPKSVKRTFTYFIA
ncbi:phosphotransferase [Spirosoma linguale]|uniref:Aminoglycoside phosphotransferase domain-containing protein n=1 Tax=Spirosoma linguale (strain ATCC 33905 / DSM 74 / LMG 10896 / Claus 1) TaxID=504472 RepID=D2QM96_SPILD|nr:hypothetical protein Slin_3148 [Spirosoma linguale DSM 74]